MVKPREDSDEVEPLEFDADGSSSKIDALMAILNASRKKSKVNKTVIFSQWTSFLDVIEPHLEDQGFKFVRMDGKMNTIARDAAMNALKTDPKVTILLASLGVCSVGLNLVSASQVILVDTWWYGLGQHQDTQLIRIGLQLLKTKLWTVSTVLVRPNPLQYFASSWKTASKSMFLKFSRRSANSLNWRCQKRWASVDKLPELAWPTL